MNKIIPLGTSSLVVAVTGILAMAVVSLRPGDHTVINGIIVGIITLFVQNDVKTNQAAQQREGIAQIAAKQVEAYHKEVNGMKSELVASTRAEGYVAGEKQGETQGRANEAADNMRREEAKSPTDPASVPTAANPLVTVEEPK